MMKSHNHRAKILTSKIYYLKQRNNSCPDPRMLKNNPLTVHLSSALQSERRHALNKQMAAFARKVESSQQRKEFWLTQRPLTHEQIRNNKIQFKRQIHTSHEIKHRKTDDPNAFFLSQIADQAWNPQRSSPNHLQSAEQSKNKSRKKNYLLRRMEFKAFLRDREQQSKAQPIEKEDKVVVYEKEQLNSWQIDLKLGDEFYVKFHPIKHRLSQAKKIGQGQCTKGIIGLEPFQSIVS